MLLAGIGSLCAHAQGVESALQACVQCHGDKGVSSQPGTPHLNGQLPAYFSEALAAFAKGSRPTAVAQHKQLAAEHVAAAAKFYANEKATPRPKQNIDPAVLAKGEKIYANRCMECHPDNGRDSDKDAPYMAGQEVEFLVAQTLAFKTGARKFAFLMDDAYRGLTDDELAAVAHFFAAQDLLAAPAEKKRRRK